MSGAHVGGVDSGRHVGSRCTDSGFASSVEPADDERMIKPTSYVFSGSGTKLYAFAGALRALIQAGRHPRRVIGTSGGGLIGLFLAARWNPATPERVCDELESFLRSFRLRDLLDLGGLRWPRFWHGIYKGDRFLAKMRDVLPARWSDMKLPVFVVTADRTADTTKIWGLADDVEPALAGRATMSLPIFDAVSIRDHWHTDGGTRNNFPLDFWGPLDASVIGLRFRPLTTREVVLPGQQGDAVQVFANAVDFNLDNVDDMIEATSRLHTSIAIHAQTIYLDVPGSGMDFDVDDAAIAHMMRLGADAARAWLKGNP